MGANGYTENSLTGHDIPAASGVYLLTDVVTNATYIGSSKNVRTRAIQHFCAMRAQSHKGPYRAFAGTYAEHGSSAFVVEILELCDEAQLLVRELYWMEELKPSENTQLFCSKGIAFSEDERVRRSERVKGLWATPEYRARAVAARKGNTFAKGHKCTPEQVENRKRAARISNMKRNYAGAWKVEYARRYPEYAEDVNA